MNKAQIELLKWINSLYKNFSGITVDLSVNENDQVIEGNIMFKCRPHELKSHFFLDFEEDEEKVKEQIIEYFSSLTEKIKAIETL